MSLLNWNKAKYTIYHDSFYTNTSIWSEYLSFHMVKFEREVERYHRVYILITVRGNLFIIEILKK